jgi:uncharacterized protein YndB with AHSA1/START domain
MTSTDRIEKNIVLKAPRARVWRALTDAEELGSWFGMKLEGSFAAGRSTHGKVTHPGYEHLEVELAIETIEPQSLFSFRWHPHAIDPKVDYASEPTTLVEFTLADVEGGTHLTIVESGFDRLPKARRAIAFHANGEGWDAQLRNIERHVTP